MRKRTTTHSAWSLAALIGIVLLTGFTNASQAASEKVLYSFGTNGTRDGARPWSDLIAVNSTLYGTTESGGTACCGTVFSITPDGTESLLYSFGTNGATDGSEPRAGLTYFRGTLYGTTYYGIGRCRRGSVFSVSLSGAERVVHCFGSPPDGRRPDAALIHLHGTLYGMTSLGGTSRAGTVFSLTPNGTEHVLHNFGRGGRWPNAGLINVGGTFYNTTSGGRQYGAGGTVFSITPGGTVKVLYSFSSNGTDGYSPLGDLLYLHGTFYGTTFRGGTGNCGTGCGTVFSLTPAGVEKVLYSFKGGADGENPRAGLIAVGDTLYGTTYMGGGSNACQEGCGAVFSVTTSGSENVVHAFGGGSDGAGPAASLINIGGTLYGTTYFGGGNNACQDGCGTVFTITP